MADRNFKQFFERPVASFSMPRYSAQWFGSFHRSAIGNETMRIVTRVVMLFVSMSGCDGAPPPSLRDAVRAGDVRQVELALQNGADPNVRTRFATPVVGSRLQDPMLNVAAKQGNVEIIRLLLAHNAAVNDPGGDGLTPVGVAARYGHRELVRLLCEHGVDLHLSPTGDTALNQSLLCGDFETAELLVSHGALTVQPNRLNGVIAAWSPAVQSSNVAAVRFLLKHGVDVNQRIFHLEGVSQRKRVAATALAWTRNMIDFVQKNCDHLVGQINGTNPLKATLQSSLDHERKRLAVLKEEEQVLLESGATE